MVGRFIQEVGSTYLKDILHAAKNQGVQYSRLQMAKSYLCFISNIRTLLLLMMSLLACLSFAAGGWILAIIGASRAIGLSGWNEAYFLLGSGLATLLLPTFLFLWINREKNWMNQSHATDLAARALLSELSVGGGSARLSTI